MFERVPPKHLDAIVEAMDLWVIIRAPSGKLLYANEAAARGLGFASVREFRDVPLYDEAGRPLSELELPGVRVLRGEPRAEAVVQGRDPATGEIRWLFVVAVRIEADGPDGGCAVVTIRDVTERRKEMDTARFVAEAGAALSASLDLNTILAKIAELSVPRLAEWCRVELLNESGDKIALAAVGHVEAEKVRLIEELRRRFPHPADEEAGGRVSPLQVARSGKALFVPVVSEEALKQGAYSPEHFELMRELGIRSLMILPLSARGKGLGAMTLAIGRGERRFSEADFEVAQELARRAAYAIENSRLYLLLQKNELQLETERARLRSVLEQMPAGVLIAEAESLKVTLANAAGRNLLGSEGAEELDLAAWYRDRRIMECDGSIPAFEDLPLVRAIRRGEITTGHESILVSPSGEKTTLRCFSGPVRDQAGRIVAGVVTFYDVSTEKRAEAELRRARELALEASRLKSQFLANMSHEIRTPISAVTGMVEILLGTRLSSEQREYLLAVQQSASSLLGVVNDVLDFSKIESGRIELEIADFDLDELLRGAIGMLAFAAKRKGLELSVDKVGAPPSRLRGDPAKLRQVLTNLVANAVKFTERGRVSVRVSRASSDMLRFEVEDTGIGIESEALPRIFESFAQADSSTNRRFGGTGLGLAISKHLVEAMGGELQVRSEPGKGALFSFEIPVAVAGDGPPAESSARPGVVRQEGRAARVLLAEDNPINQKVTVRMLEMAGFKPVAVSGGAEVLELLARERFDVVLMDCQMPEVDGYEAARAIRRSSDPGVRSIPIIALTAHAVKGDRERCLESGMDDYLAKPIDVETLKRTVLRWLEPMESLRLDRSVLVNLSRFQKSGERDVIHELVEIFFESTPAKLSAMREALRAGDVKTLARESHSLKSSCANLGARSMSLLCERIERVSESGKSDISETGALLSRLEAEYREVKGELDAYVT